MNDNGTIVFESSDRQACSDRALVLTSLNIPYEILSDELRCMLVVPAEAAEKAKYEIWQYDKENQPVKRVKPRLVPDFQNAVPGVAIFGCTSKVATGKSQPPT